MAFRSTLIFLYHFSFIVSLGWFSCNNNPLVLCVKLGAGLGNIGSQLSGESMEVHLAITYNLTRLIAVW